MPARRHALLLILLTLRTLAVPGEPPSSPCHPAHLYVVGDSISAPPTWPRELAFLPDRARPALLWLSGRPDDEATWNATAEACPGAHQMWVGPGYIPLQFHVSFSDTIHLNTAANRLLAAHLRDELAARGW
jgi:hypothetical protein